MMTSQQSARQAAHARGRSGDQRPSKARWLPAAALVALLLSGCVQTGSNGAAVPGGVQQQPQTVFSSNQAINVPGVVVNPSQYASGTYAAASPARLSDSEIHALLAGRSIKQVDDQFVATFETSGVMRATYYNADQVGNWQVRGNKLCQSFREWNAGRATCFDVIRGSGGIYRFHDSSNNDGYSFRVR